MKRNAQHCFVTISTLLVLTNGTIAESRSVTPNTIERSEIEQAPVQLTEVAIPESLPVNTAPGQDAPLSIDNPANQNDYMTYTPYNLYPREIDLWDIEGKHLIQSIPVVSPDKSVFVYSEVMFIASLRQTYSRVYWVKVPPLPMYPPRKPSEPAPPVISVETYHNRFNPQKNIQGRKLLTHTGSSQAKRFDFKTLTIVDWSASGKRLLLKERSGILHLGLRTSNILVHDELTGIVTVYPEVHRVISYYWQTKKNMPELPDMSFDIQPLGWQVNSDSVILLKAWAYDNSKKKFLGVWQYDINEERTKLLQLNNTPVTVAANGWVAEPIEAPILDQSPPRSFWKKVKSVFD